MVSGLMGGLSYCMILGKGKCTSERKIWKIDLNKDFGNLLASCLGGNLGRCGQTGRQPGWSIAYCYCILPIIYIPVAIAHCYGLLPIAIAYCLLCTCCYSPLQNIVRSHFGSRVHCEALMYFNGCCLLSSISMAGAVPIWGA